MPRGKKAPNKSVKSSNSAKPDPRFAAVLGAKNDIREAFATLVKKDLGRLLGADGLRRLRTDRMIFSPAGPGIVAHASFKTRRPLTLENLRRYAPIVAVQVNTIPLIDPITRTALEPGTYAIRLRPVGGTRFAFDYLREGDKLPVFSTSAEPVARQQGPLGQLWDSIDIIIRWPIPEDPEPHELLPPGTPGRLCISILSWDKCWDWDWPEIDWPWGLL